MERKSEAELEREREIGHRVGKTKAEHVDSVCLFGLGWFFFVLFFSPDVSVRDMKSEFFVFPPHTVKLSLQAQAFN